MTTARLPRHSYTYEEYLRADEDAGRTKLEFCAGEIYAMAGGSPRHNALAARIGGLLVAQVGPGCIVFQSDQRIRCLASGRATYPDVSVVCGALEYDPADPARHTLLNPVLIVEVLSPSTEADDRGAKWESYQQIPSLAAYLLVSQHAPQVEVFWRQAERGWSYVNLGPGQSLPAPALSVSLAVDEVFREPLPPLDPPA